jgi:hypothetical protein
MPWCAGSRVVPAVAGYACADDRAADRYARQAYPEAVDAQVLRTDDRRIDRRGVVTDDPGRRRGVIAVWAADQRA